MEPGRGRIITFYSYKGGTGRSMALVNLACLLSRRDDIERGVLTIDWDLEAPGLHWFFRDANPDRSERAASGTTQHGVLDLFTILESEIQHSSHASLPEEAVQQIVSKLDLEHYIVSTPVSRVDLMPAGCFDKDYGDRVGRFDWRNLFQKAPSLIRALAERLGSKYDYVLVDSRTGVNDISGICTALLPDQLVLVFTANHQSLISGIETAGRAAQYRMQSDDLRRLAIFPLPSRIDISEPELLEKWRFGDSSKHEDTEGYQKRFEDFFTDIYGLPSCSLKNYFDEVQIQHVPRYSYGEEIAALHERGSRLSVLRSYATVADILAKNMTPWTMPPAGGGDSEVKTGPLPSIGTIRSVKEYLSEDRFRLRLHDLVTRELGIATTRAKRFELQEF